MGGYRYALSCVDALLALPPEERPELHLLWSTPGDRQDAQHLLAQVDGHAHLATASRLGLDFVYPVKEMFEAPSGVPWGGWIVDWQQRYLPEMFEPGEHATREFRYRVMVDSAPVVAHSSRQACDDSRRWVPSATAALEVFHFRATLEDDALSGDVGDVLRRYDLPPRFALVCNQWYRHKNHLVVIEALKLLRERGLTIPCVVTGRPEDHRWPDYGPSLERLIVELGLTDTVRLVGLVPRFDQLLLIRAASVVVQPSLFEGWSTIVEESRSLGKTIVLSDIPVHREQAPPAGHFFDPASPAALADALERVWTAPPGDEAARVAQARAEHGDLQIAAGRRLVELAHLAMERFDPRRHDPARTLLRMIREAAHLGSDEEPTRTFAAQSTIMWFARHPWRFPGFAADLLESDEVTRDWFRKAVIPRLVQHRRRIYHQAFEDQALDRIVRGRALVEIAGDLLALR
jgi:glycosyltransferase involved in cell wall biosynthesis